MQDFGPGIPKEEQARLFGQFERLASPSVSGLGLGLFNSRKIIESHGGTIEVLSSPGCGSVFTVVLPRMKGGKAA